jgi:hypothetical protein
MPEQPDRLEAALQALFDLVETYGGERLQQQQEMWGQIEDAMVEVVDAGIDQGRRDAEQQFVTLIAAKLGDRIPAEGAHTVPLSESVLDLALKAARDLGRREAGEGPAFNDADVEVLAELSRRELGAAVVRWRDWERARQILGALTANGRRLVGPWEPAPAVNAEQPDPITPEVYGEFFPERDDAGEPLPADRPWPICWAQHQGMLCDRKRGHDGDHVDIYGPLTDHTWPREQLPADQPEPSTPAERLSPETIASVLAVVDAPYRPDTPVEYLDDEETDRG